MGGLTELLGDTLLGKSGCVGTDEALSGKAAIALYFSAHWCPPCRGFTPQLAKWYSENLKEKGLEVVFVSSDRDEDAFKEYHGEMPWLAIPYENRAKKDELSKKYKVQGIPTIVVISPEGELITKDGRSAISGDPTGNNMPWKPRSFHEIFSEAKLLGPGGTQCLGSSLKGKVFGVYFSAHWCPPCRGFTPKLAEWYKKDLRAKGFEVVFVSSDRDEGAFKEYFAEQPWLALDYSDRKRKEELNNLFGIEGIPSLVIIGEDGCVITKEGRAAVSADPTGEEFPWHPKPIGNLKAGPGSINEVPTVVAFCEGSDAPTQKRVEEAMLPIAKRLKAEAKAKGEEDPEIGFLMVTEAEGLSGRIRSMLKMQALSPKAAGGSVAAPPKLMLVDIPDNGGFYEGPEGDVTESLTEKFVADYKAKSLERRQMEG